jgi:hypothetical protein
MQFALRLGANDVVNGQDCDIAAPLGLRKFEALNEATDQAKFVVHERVGCRLRPRKIVLRVQPGCTPPR